MQSIDSIETYAYMEQAKILQLEKKRLNVAIKQNDTKNDYLW